MNASGIPFSRLLLFGCSAVGLIVALMSVNIFYTEGESFCNVNDRFNCDVVLKGPNSEFLGIPIPILGVIAYLGFGLLIFFERRIAQMLTFTQKDYWWYVSLITTFMLCFQTYLTIRELLITQKMCPLCLTSQVLVIILPLITWTLWYRSKE